MIITRRKLLVAGGGGLIAAPAIINRLEARNNLPIARTASGGGGGGTFAFVTSGFQSGTAGPTTVVTGLNTTGADLLIMVDSTVSGVTSVFSDSNSNTWTPFNAGLGSTNVIQAAYTATRPTVGSGHNFTSTSTGNFHGLIVFAFSGSSSPTADPLDQSNGISNSIPATTIQAGLGITPITTNQLVVTFCATSGRNITAVNSAFSSLVIAPFVVGVSTTAAGAYIIETSIIAKNPIWTLDAATSDPIGTFTASFKHA